MIGTSLVTGRPAQIHRHICIYTLVSLFAFAYLLVVLVSLSAAPDKWLRADMALYTCSYDMVSGAMVLSHHRLRHSHSVGLTDASLWLHIYIYMKSFSAYLYVHIFRGL